MIPGLLHGRLLGGGGGGSGIVNPPDFDGGEYIDYQVQPTGPVTASVSFNINADGTWSAYAGAAGNWFAPTTGGVGSGYEVRITPTATFGSGTVVNDASGWISLSAARTITISKTRTTSGSSTCRYDVLVEVRVSGGGAAVLSGTFQVETTADIS